MSLTFKKELSTFGEFEPIKPGVYKVKFESLEEKPTMAGGIQWSAKMKIVDSVRTFFLNWNVEHTNEKTQKIAREQISQIADLLGVGDDISIESLKTNKVFIIQLEQNPYNDKMYYQTKGNWKLDDDTPKTLAEGVKKVQDAMKIPAPAATVPAKKKNPWDRA